MKNRSMLMQVKTYTSNLFFYGCRWSMLITAYALIAIIIVMSSETYFSEGVYAAEVAYATEAYDFTNQDDVLCMSVAHTEVDEQSDDAKVREENSAANLSVKAREENNAVYTVSTMALEPIKQMNVNILDSVVNDSSVDIEKQVAETVKKKKASKKESKEAFQETDMKAVKIKLSSGEKSVLMRIVEAEATGEDIKGKMLVANVVLNRMNNKRFPNTVEGVVFQKNGSVYQFSPIKDGRYYKVDISNETKKAVNRVLNGEDESQGALYFMSRSRAKSTSVTWFDRSLTRVFKYGTHEFYK